MDIRDTMCGSVEWNGIRELRTGCCEHGNKTDGFINMAGICWLEERLLVSQEKLFSIHWVTIQLVSWLVSWLVGKLVTY